MAIDQESFNNDLYRLLRTRGYKPVPKDAKNQRTQPEAAEVFNFTFMKDGKDYGDAWVTIDDASNVVLYYSNEQEESPSGKSPGLDYDDSWSGLKRHLKQWSMNKQLTFELRNKDELGDDMARRKYVKKKEKMNEAYHPMGKKASYNDNIPAVKIILQHNRQIEEGEQRYRNIAKIFLENQDGERFLAPTTRPGIAQVYARHIAEGGVPNDERWNHIKAMCEEYSKMAGFVRATKNKQFNESAQSLVSEGINHYQSLRETLGKLRGHRGYNQYFESWTPALMEDDTDGNEINELFVQETVDPRIESVMPILSRLYKKTGETPVKEVKELEQWADSIVEGEETLENINDFYLPFDQSELSNILRKNQAIRKEEFTDFYRVGIVHGFMRDSKDVIEVRWNDGKYSAENINDLEFASGPYRHQNIGKVLSSLKGRLVDLDEAKSDSFRRKFNKAMSWDYSNPKEMIKKIRSYTDQDLLDLYHHPEEEQKLDGSARALQLKLIRQELKRRYGLTPKGNINPEETLEGLDKNQKKAGQLGPTEKIGKKGETTDQIKEAHDFTNTTIDRAAQQYLDKNKKSMDTDVEEKRAYIRGFKAGLSGNNPDDIGIKQIHIGALDRGTADGEIARAKLKKRGVEIPPSKIPGRGGYYKPNSAFDKLAKQLLSKLAKTGPNSDQERRARKAGATNNEIKDAITKSKKIHEHEAQARVKDEFDDMLDAMSDDEYYDYAYSDMPRMKGDSNPSDKKMGIKLHPDATIDDITISEKLDKNQKKAGQLGPTEKIGKKGAVGNLVGVSEGRNDLRSKLMKAWNSGMELDSVVQQFGPEAETIWKELENKYGVESISVPDLYGYKSKEPTDPNVRLHRGLDGPGKDLRDIIRTNETVEEGTPEHEVIMDLINGNLDAYDVMNHPRTPAQKSVAAMMQERYDEITTEYPLHADDDFDKILNKLVDELADDYDTSGYQDMNEGQDDLDLIKRLMK